MPFFNHALQPIIEHSLSMSHLKKENKKLGRAISIQSNGSSPDLDTDAETKIPQKWLKSRSKNYSDSNVRRYVCPPNKYEWAIPFDDYKPRNYTSDSVLNAPYADPSIKVDSIPFNNFETAKGINRRSHVGEYKLVNDVPRNPLGRTGITGRGDLGLWGPNHAVDPIVTRWKKGQNDRKVLEWIAIQRENGEWAIPGGMIRAKESRPVGKYLSFVQELAIN